MFLAASVKLYIDSRSMPMLREDGFKTLPFHDFRQIHDWKPMGAGGSGTVIHVEGNEALVITCKHVISRPSTVTVTYYNKHSVRGEFLMADRYADLAAVVIPANATTPVVPVATNRVARGTTVQQAGYPGGVGPITRVAKVYDYAGRQPYDMMVSFVSRPGDSGSGLFNPVDRALCGVVWGGDGSHAVAVEQYDIQRFYQTCLPIFRGRRPGSPSLPGAPGPGDAPPNPGLPGVPSIPVPPPGTNPPSQPVLPDSGLKARIEALEGLLAKLVSKDRVDSLEKSLEGAKSALEHAKSTSKLLEAGLTDLRNSGLISQSKADGLKDKLDFVSGFLGKISQETDGKIADKIAAVVESIKTSQVLVDGKFDGKLAPVIEALKKAADVALSAEQKAELAKTIGATAGGWASWLPLIGIGSATGGAGAIALSILGLYRRFGRSSGATGVLVTDDLFRKFLGKGQADDKQATVPAPANDPLKTILDLLKQRQQPPEVVKMQTMPLQDNPPIVVSEIPQVRTEHQVVRVPDTSGEEALRRALKIASENGIINPSVLGPIENLARQVLSGESSGAK